MIYKIPDSLAPYLEYIPEDILEQIINDALRERIFQEPSVQVQEASVQSADMNQILEQIKSLLGKAPIPAKATEQIVESVKPETTVKPVIFETDNPDEEIDDDMLDLIGDFASGLFK